MHSKPRQQRAMSYLYAPAALTLRKESPVPDG